jgi:hypothetical protein
MGFEEGIVLKDELMHLLPKELPNLLQESQNRRSSTGHMNGFHLNIAMFKIKSQL